MVLPFKKLRHKNSSATSADVIDGHLTLSLLDAIEPKIWRTSLDKIGSACFELKQSSHSEVTKLVLKPKKGTAEIIAEFQTKKEAFDALTAASNALQNGIPQTKTTNNKQNDASASTPPLAQQNVQKKTSKWVVIFWGIVIVVGLYYYMTSLIPDQTTDFGQAANNINATSTAPQDAVGVPVSADDFLNGL